MASTKDDQLERQEAGASPARPWPTELEPVFERASTVEYSSLTAAGAPITVPVTPYLSETGATIDVSTGVTYPAKAERARRNAKVALLFADSLGSVPNRTPVALVQGFASVRDRDLQANTDRYIRRSMDRFPEAYVGQPRWMLRRSAWYFARIWIEVTPVRILWWPDGHVDLPPREWNAPDGTSASPSDLPPEGDSPRRPAQRPRDWRADAAAAVKFELHDVTVVDSDGFPLIVPVRALEQTAGGFRLHIATGAKLPTAGPACLTAHTHDVPFTSQQNRTFVGRLTHRGGAAELEVDRLLPDWSIPSGRLAAAVGFLRAGRRLRPRLAAESARRGQRPPEVRLPERA